MTVYRGRLVDDRPRLSWARRVLRRAGADLVLLAVLLAVAGVGLVVIAGA